MSRSLIQGEAGEDASISLNSADAAGILLDAQEIKAERMPATEHQPELEWLVQISLAELNDELRNKIATAKEIHCQATVRLGTVFYSFLGVEFIGASENIINFGANILRHRVIFN